MAGLAARNVHMFGLYAEEPPKGQESHPKDKSLIFDGKFNLRPGEGPGHGPGAPKRRKTIKNYGFSPFRAGYPSNIGYISLFTVRHLTVAFQNLEAPLRWPLSKPLGRFKAVIQNGLTE